jgi:ATP-binding cassette subfamily C protein
VIRKSSVAPDETTATGLRDLEAVQRLLSSPVLTALFDIPWTPFFLAGIWIFHPWLGVLALVGGAILFKLAWGLLH